MNKPLNPPPAGVMAGRKASKLLITARYGQKTKINMPRYFLLEIQTKKKSRVLGLTPNCRSIRAAWVWVKKNIPRSLNKKYDYHLFPINHSRNWRFDGNKWVIRSWYDNHKRDTKPLPLPG